MWNFVNKVFNSAREKDHFFYKATQHKNFRYYQMWCSDWRIAISNIEMSLEKKDLKTAEHYFREIMSTRIPSVIYFHIYLDTLEKEVRKRTPFLLASQNPFEKMRQQFRKNLRENKELATNYFQQEVAFQLTELMAKQTTIQQLLVKLHYYEALVSPSIYNKVIAQIKQFIEMNPETSHLYPSFYSESDSSSDQYQTLFSALDTIFNPQPSKTTIRSTKTTTRSSRNMLFSILSIMPWLALTTAARVTATQNSQSDQFDLSAIDGTNGFYVPGLEPSDKAGWSLASGDINADGIPDLIIGIDSASPNNITDAGMVCVIFGNNTTAFPEVFDLSTLDGSNGFCINGIASGDRFGYSVTTGDVTGDRIKDLIVSAPFASSSSYKKCGTVYVFEGSNEPFAATMSASSAKATINGVNNYNGNINDAALGVSLSADADINKDGINDILMGATGVSYGGDHAGATYVALGGITLTGVFSVTAFNGPNGFMIAGAVALGYAGMSVVPCDVNQDGIPDIIIGAYGISSATGAPQAGVIYIVFGGPTVFVSLGNLANKGWVMSGTVAYGQLGQAQSLSCADINDDGYVELIASAREASSISGEEDAGITYILPGKKNYYSAAFDVSAAIPIYGDTNTNSGWTTSSSYINDDLYSDVLIGTYTGETYIWYGSANFSGPSQLNQITNTTGFIITWDENSSNEMSLATGDLNGDNQTEIWIGYSQANNGGEQQAGRVYVVLNTSTSLPPQNSNSSSYSSSSYSAGNESGYNNIAIIISIIIGGLVIVTASGTVVYCAAKRKPIDPITTPLEPGELKSLVEVRQANYGTEYIGEIQFNEKDLLGGGAYGIVYKGMWNEKVAAIKVMSSTDVLPQYEHEVQIMRQLLPHPNVIGFYYATMQQEPHRNRYFIAMEYAENGSLRNLLDRTPHLSPPDCQKFAEEIAKGLKYLHDQNVIHRDLKCANVVLGKDKKAKLCDFGLSAKIAESYRSTSGNVVGSLPWMAPEIFQGQGYNEKTDVFSFGVVLWEITTGKRPSNQRPLPTQECPVKYAALMGKCWDKRNARPIVSEILETLEEDDGFNNNNNYPGNSQSIDASHTGYSAVGNSRSLMS